VNELNSTVTVCEWQDGTLTTGQVCSTLQTFDGGHNYPAEIVASADGLNTIAVFAIEDGGARVRLLATPHCGGSWPRHLALDHTGRWLYCANERSGDLAWFPVGVGTGLPGPIAGRVPATGVTQLRV
jgi:6-phosphogluconolactonase